MSAHRSPLTLALERLLADGEWHDVDDVVAELAPLVPPGRAYRRGEARRLAKAGAGLRVRGDRSTAIASGARHIADDTVRSGIRYGRIESQGDAIRARGGDRA